MRRSATGLVAAAVIAAGVAGCSLPEVLPLAGGTTAGPSPYGSWYEQHWATNSVLLSATDEDGGEFLSDDVAAFEEQPAGIDPGIDETHKVHVEITPARAQAPVETNADATLGAEPTDFDNSSAYQFPSDNYAPKAAPPARVEPVAPPVEVVPPSGAIRY